MITVISIIVKDNKTYLVLKCEVCGNQFDRLKTWVDHKIKHSNIKSICCSKKCTNFAKTKEVSVECFLCKRLYTKHPCDAKRGVRSFCSASCRSTYYNKNKTYGSVRSKLEAYIEEKINSELSDLVVRCNDRQAIGSELDFYFPGLNAAIQVNGITHYKPIYGNDKFNRIRSLDKEKKTICKDKGILLFVINSSKDKKNDRLANDKHWTKIKCWLSKLPLALLD